MPRKSKPKKPGPKKPRRIALLPPGPRTMQVVHYSQGRRSVPQGAKGKFAVEIVEKMPKRGKPPLSNKIRQDQIVGYVRFLLKADPWAKMDEVIIPEVAKFFNVSKKTVWNALHAHRELDPDKSIPAGAITFWLHED